MQGAALSAGGQSVFRSGILWGAEWVSLMERAGMAVGVSVGRAAACAGPGPGRCSKASVTTSPVPVQPLLFRASLRGVWVWHGPGIVRTFPHRKGREPPGSKVTMLQDTTAFRCHRGRPGVVACSSSEGIYNLAWGRGAGCRARSCSHRGDPGFAPPQGLAPPLLR